LFVYQSSQEYNINIEIMTSFIIKALDISRSVNLNEALAGLKSHYRVASQDPLVFALNEKENQYLLIARYGVIVISNWSEDLEAKALAALLPYLNLPSFAKAMDGKPAKKIENFDELKVSIEPQKKPEVFFDEVVISKFDEKFMLVIGNLMSQSVGLDSYEKKIESLLATLDKQITKLEKNKFLLNVSPFIKNIIGVMRFEQEMIASVGILDKPDLVWNDKDLDSLYHSLSANLEIPERTEILSTKINVLRNNTTTVLDILDARKANFLEWIIIFLILAEIIITLVEKII